MDRPSSISSVSPWMPDLNSGQYVNPVLFADYSDPDVIRVGDDYWLTASSFNCTPGLPILHSKDLVNWSIVGHAVKNLPHPRYAQVQPGCGIWAPAIRHHGGKFWIFFPTPDEGIYRITASDPRGPWSDPHLVQAGRGLIDPCPLWDDDGRAYLVFAYAGSRAGIKHRLDIREMSPDGMHLIGPAHTLFLDPEHHPTAEGPKFYKRGQTYYIFAPAGGVDTGWQLVLKSDHVLGPYEHRVVLAQGATPVNGPHQGGLVSTPTGEEWFLHFQERQPYGRIVHLQPVVWEAGWPIIGEASAVPGVGQPVMRHKKPAATAVSPAAPATSDLFDTPHLGRQWQWHANHHDDWYSLTERAGWLRLRALPADLADLSLTPHLLLQKLPAPQFQVTTQVEIQSDNTSAGIAVVGKESAAILLSRSGDQYRVVLRVRDGEAWSTNVNGPSIRLRVQVNEGGLCHFAFCDAASWVELPTLFTAVEGVWIGAKIGLLAHNVQSVGSADFNAFQVEPLASLPAIDQI